jgi:hypothetical protein
MNLRKSKRSLIFLIFLFASADSIAQINSDDGLTIGGYVEAYYFYDFNDPEKHFRPTFINNYNRTNEVYVKPAMIKLFQSGSNTKTIRDYTFRNVERSIVAKGLMSKKSGELKNKNFATISSLSLTF